MRKLLILSGKGGTGKTTIATAFIRFSKAKAIADCDVDAPNLHLVNRAEGQREEVDFIGSDRAQVDPAKCVGCALCASHCRFSAITLRDQIAEISPYACEGCGVCAYVCPQKAISMVPDVSGKREIVRGDTLFSTAELKMGRGNSGKLVNEVKAVLREAKDTAPLAIIDGSPGIGCPVISSITGVDLTLIAAEPSLSGKSDLERLLQTADMLQVPVVVCVNKFDVDEEKTAEIQALCDRMDVPFVGKIPFDPAASKAINEGISVADFPCAARDAIREVFDRVMDILAHFPT